MHLVGFVLHVVSWFGVPGYEIMAVLSPFFFLPACIFSLLLFNRNVVVELMRQFNFWYLNINILLFALAAGAIFKWDARAFSIIAIVLLYYPNLTLMDARLGRSRAIRIQKIAILVCGLIYFVFLVLGCRLRWFPNLHIESPIFIIEEYALTVTAGGVFYVRAWFAFIFQLRYLFHAACYPRALVVLTKNGTVAYNSAYNVQAQSMGEQATETETTTE